MLKKLLGAALAAAMVLTLSAGAFGADVYYTGGGGGGGGGGDDIDGGAAVGGLGGDAMDGTGASTIGGGAGGLVETAGGAAVGNTGTRTGDNAVDADGNGGRGVGGQHLSGADGAPFEIDYDTITANDNLHFLGGNGGNAGTTGQITRGGGGGNGGDVVVNLTNSGANSVTGNINITGGTGGNAAATVNAHTGGRGGNGGNVNVTAGTLTVDTDTITIAGGTAGTGQAAAADAGSGGSASFTADAITLENNASIVVKNGDKASAEGAEGYANGFGRGGNASFSVGTLSAGATGGSFTTVGGTANDGTGMGLRNIAIGTVEALDGDMALNFTDISLDDGDKAAFGNVIVGDGRTFGVTGARGSQYDWTGNLTTYNKATVNGLDATGKNITMIVDDPTFDFITGPIVDGTMTVAADTSVMLDIDADNAYQADLWDSATVINLFDGVTDIAELEDQTFDIVTGGFRGTGVFDANGDSLAGSIRMYLTEDTYTALLAAPALATLVNGGADVVERAAGSFNPMAIIGGNACTQFGMFASIGGARMDVDTGAGSDIESNNFHLLVGPGLRINSGTGRTDIGAFFEAGWGSFDTINGNSRGEGDSGYYGGGLLLRHDTCFGLYAEASLRFGAADAEYVNNNADTDYDFDSSYVGGHLGLGYIFRPSDTSSFELFAKGLLTRLNDDTAEDSAGYTIAVDSTDSFRTQLGAKYSYNFCNTGAFYVKGVWEHEFNGETSGRYDRFDILRDSDMGGSSVIGEVGVNWQIAERASLGASVYGIAGQRQGFGGNLSLGIGF